MHGCRVSREEGEDIYVTHFKLLNSLVLLAVQFCCFFKIIAAHLSVSLSGWPNYDFVSLYYVIQVHVYWRWRSTI